MGKPMSRTKKFLIGVLVFSFLSMFALVLLWFNARNEKEMRQDIQAQIQNIEALMAHSKKENIALLSVKYGVEPVQLEHLVDAYRYRHDIAYRMKRDIAGGGEKEGRGGASTSRMQPDQNFGATLDNLSVQYNIPRDRLAGLLADYKVLSALEKEDVIETMLSTKARSSMMKFSFRGAFAGAKWLFAN